DEGAEVHRAPWGDGALSYARYHNLQRGWRRSGPANHRPGPPPSRVDRGIALIGVNPETGVEPDRFPDFPTVFSRPGMRALGASGGASQARWSWTGRPYPFGSGAVRLTGCLPF